MPDVFDGAKKTLGEWAASQIPHGIRLGIGSGSTVSAFIEALGERNKREPLGLTVAAASKASEMMVRGQGITVVPLETLTSLDLAVDGADKVDLSGVLIKGGGAALVRERLIIAASERTLILVDKGKLMNTFHQVSIPVAMIPYGWRQTLSRLSRLSGGASLRTLLTGPVVTDDGLYVADVKVDAIPDPEAWHRRFKMVEGVVDTGLFAGYATEVWVSDGTRTQPYRIPGAIL